jgi:hypothetical protein
LLGFGFLLLWGLLERVVCHPARIA